MASNYTENYDLCQWEATDQVLRTEFNAENDKVDRALKGLADQNTALEEILSSHAKTISNLGNCQLYISSYTGTGENGTTISQSFPKQPLAVIVAGSQGGLMVMLQGLGQATHFGSGSYSYMDNVTWSGTRVSWRSTQNAGGEPQMNVNGVTYKVLALLDAAS